MTCREVTARLSEYLDGALDDQARQELAGHLAACEGCRAVAADLDRIRSAARTLGPITPPAHLWLEIAGRIRIADGASATPPSAVTPAPTRSAMWQWTGLAAALLLMTAVVYFSSRPASGPSADAVMADGNVSAPATVETIADTLQRAQAEYERAIAQLEEMIRSGDASVSDEAIATLQRNVVTIDSAIAESRAALTENPASQPARTSLFEALGQKVNLLQQTVVLMNEMRQGDAGGAADAAAGIRTKT